jgi:hypothetical protein
VAKLDNFFRLVDKKYGTEGIVLLTYDFNYLGADNAEIGWSFGVPDQKNTGGHCDYDKANVIAELSDQTRIVGTVHSHPHMRAYASQTDHNDQAGFDGIHITFGWSTTTKGQTEYHAEMVRGGNFIWISPEDVLDLENEYVFELNNKTTLKKGIVQIPISNLTKVKREIPLEKEEEEELLSRVSKASHSVTTHYNGNTSIANKAGGSGKAPSPTKGQQLFIDPNTYLPDKDTKYVEPLGLQKFNFTGTGSIPDPLKNNVLIRIEGSDLDLESCKLCNTVWNTSSQVLFGRVLERRQCIGCGVFILLEDEDLKDMDDVRVSKGYYPLKNFYNFDIPTVIWDLRGEEGIDWKPSFEVIEASDSKK